MLRNISTIRETITRNNCNQSFDNCKVVVHQKLFGIFTMLGVNVRDQIWRPTRAGK